MKKYQKLKENKWLKVSTVTFDMCDYLNGANFPAFRIFYSGYIASLDPSLVHPCPFSVSISIFDSEAIHKNLLNIFKGPTTYHGD
jgi:hypothetical protein